MITYSETDIDVAFATRAHNGISFSPERRAQQLVDEYMAHMAQVAAEFSGYATDDNFEDIVQALSAYRTGYLRRLNVMLAARSRCISSFITGPSNFPVRRARKANEAEHNRAGDFYLYQDWKLEKLRRTFDPSRLAHAPIRLDNPDVIVQLEKKLADLRRRQAVMTATNKIVRSAKLQQLEKLDLLVSDVGISEEDAIEALADGGFARFQLSNNRANIKRVEDRLAQALREQRRTQPDDYAPPAGVSVVENKELTRIQLVFDDKPPAEIRAILKRNGFRWAPSQNAWQRLLNANGRAAAKYVLRQMSK